MADFLNYIIWGALGFTCGVFAFSSNRWAMALGFFAAGAGCLAASAMMVGWPALGIGLTLGLNGLGGGLTHHEFNAIVISLVGLGTCLLRLAESPLGHLILRLM